MTSYMLKHLGMFDEYNQHIENIRANDDHRYELTRIIKIAIQYFAERPCDSIDLQPIIYVEYNPILLNQAEELLLKMIWNLLIDIF